MKNRNIHWHGVGLALLSLYTGIACAQGTAPAADAAAAHFAGYLAAVEKHSLDLASQRESITAAEAGVSIAGVVPDPKLTLGYGPKEFSKAIALKPPVSRTVALEWEIETAGKRDKRVRLAKSNVKLTEANVEGFKHQLYSDSAAAFAEACRTREALVRQESSLRSLSEVVRANEVRRKAGDAGGLELLQSRTERDQFQAGVVKGRADAQAAMLNLSVPLGQRFDALFAQPRLDCDFADFAPGDDVDALIRQALDARDEVLIARATLDNARVNAELVQANRYVNPTVKLTAGRTPMGRSSFDGDGKETPGSPVSRTLAVEVAIPLPFSRLQKGEVIQAESAVTQAMLGLRAAELKTDAEVRASYAQFLAARENLRRYRESVLADSDKVLSGMRLSYRNGQASLLEFLAAQRSADDAYLAYLQAQADLVTATVQLQLSVGLHPAL
ncbi:MULTISPECIES: TolC family protein [unclassified Variovorax]|jgi:cobalt-zinc-cadmium efflux system outer membrane protein|uniref:TolC family protein n=1 Tax=unclassified Variovorax TaxID=663243 RepID=UPI000F7FA95A|nr:MULTISPECIES: TolC family protein [unclassified Variovorax]RSZ30187.1 TolC family protein [Variovorax sp. 553]RSZ30692.1 TolC family protein [Variovorax sp. 679]